MQRDDNRVEVTISDRVVYVRVIGLATMHNCGALSDFCNAMMDGECREILFDLKVCTGMDSTFMGVIAGLSLRYKTRPDPVVVINATDHCLKLMQGLGLNYVVQIRMDPVDVPDVEAESLRDDWASDQEKLRFIKQAHENLVTIDQRNQDRFGHFLETFAKTFATPQGEAKVRFAICNEFCENWEIESVFKLAADAGYEGVEIAPFTIAPDVREISADQRKEIAQQAQDNGVEVIGLHWLLVSPEGLYVNHTDKAIRDETAAYFKALIHCCADLGGNKLVIGSPKQRNVMDGLTYQQAWDYAKEVFTSLLPDAEERGVDLCIEPLTTNETDFITTAAEGVRLCKEIDHPKFRLHLDVKAMSGEGRPLDEIIKESEGFVAHFHANDANRGYPGSGDSDFRPVVEALEAIGYDGWVSVEVFDFSPGPEKIATESRRYLKEVFGV